MIIGLTGGIGSGKTTVSDIFADLSISIVDADIVAREIVEPNTLALKQITKYFGVEILNKDQTLNRAKLREIVFAESAHKGWLNHLLHPIIRQEIKQQLAQSTTSYTLLVAPLLLENGLENIVDKVLVVDVSEETQIARSCQRDGSSRETIQGIIDSQISRDKRLAAADDIIVNESLSLDELKKQVQQLHQKYLSLAAVN